MKKIRWILFAVLLGSSFALYAANPRSREYLTEAEIARVQAEQKIKPRVAFYLQAALSRLKSAESRLRREAIEPGDPLEYFTPEDMIEGYYQILNSVMTNLEDAHERGNRDRSSIPGALKELKKRMQQCELYLDSLETLAKEQENKALLQLIQKAGEATQGALAGAEYALKEKTYDTGQ